MQEISLGKILPLKSYLLEKNVSSINNPLYISYLLFLFIVFTVKGQETAYNGYQIVPEVIARDTVPDEFIQRVLHNLIISGKITKEESINQLLKLKREQPLLLISRATNKYAQEKLAKQYLDTEEIAKYIGRNLLLKIVEKIGPDQNHPKKLCEKGIEIITEKPKIRPHHYFSSPLEIQNNRFIIYHFKSLGRGVGRSEFIIYYIDQNENIEIEKTFVLWEH